MFLLSYKDWDEEQKLDFLTRELQTKRPLVPADMPMSDEVREVMDTCRVAARLGAASLGAYVISMAQKASDVLCVELLQKEARMQVRSACFDVNAVLLHHESQYLIRAEAETVCNCLQQLDCGALH